MKNLVLVVLALMLSLALAGMPMGAAEPDKTLPFPDIPRITIKETRALLGDPNMVIIDVRPAEQWKSSDQMLPHAVHEDLMDVDSWAHRYAKDKTIILYCA